jgi:hypothetical protein
MDADDVCLPRRIEKQVAFMQRRGNIGILCAQARLFGDRIGVFAPRLKNPEHMRTELFFTCPIIHPTVMFRASFLKKHGLRYSENPEHRAAEDFELWSRIARLGLICEYPHVLLRYRVHARQVSSAPDGAQIQAAGRIRAALLSLLDIAPDAHDTSVHGGLCVDVLPPDATLNETELWARRLLEANASLAAFPKRYFRQAVIRRFFVIAVKALLKRRVTLRQLLCLPLMRQALMPVHYLNYLKRILFSKRLNRVI